MGQYGFEFRNDQGQTYFNSTQTGLRHVATHYIPRNWSGVINEPKFSNVNGVWFLKPHLLYWDLGGGLIGYGGNPFNYNNYPSGTGQTLGASRRPSTSWNESNKQMSITASSGSSIQDINVHYYLRFFHYV